MNLFYQPERWFQLLSPAVMMDPWELVWLCGWVWETPSQWVWIRGNGRITWKASELYMLGSCCGPTDTGSPEGGGSCPFGRSFLGDFCCIILIKSHPACPLPILDPSRGCGHLARLGCHVLCDWNPSRVIMDPGLCWTPSGTHSCLLATNRAVLTVLTTEHLHLHPMTVSRRSLHALSHVTI